jgi:hypothetical protein
MSKGLPLPSYLDLLLGKHGGSLGETCALALILGGLYLLIRRVITWHIPVAFIGTVALMSLVCGQDVLGQLLSGGLMLGAIFMATDYATPPTTKWGKIIFGVGCGLITVLIRFWGKNKQSSLRKLAATTLENPEPHLRALGVQQDSSRQTQLISDPAEHVDGLLVRLMGPMGEVQSSNVHPRLEQTGNDLLCVAGRTQRANDLCALHFRQLLFAIFSPIISLERKKHNPKIVEFVVQSVQGQGPTKGKRLLPGSFTASILRA